MGFIAQDSSGVKDGAAFYEGGNKSYTLTAANDQTNLIPMRRGEQCFIHANMTGACTLQVLVYQKPGGTGIPADYNGTTSFTADFALNFVASGKCFISVIMTVDGGSAVVTVTK